MLARQHAVNIIAGTVANRKPDGGIYNTACVFDRKGELTAQYDKVHLFSPSGEHEFFRCGDRPCNFELDGIPCSLAVCYDIRFPELIRSEMRAGSKFSLWWLSGRKPDGFTGIPLTVPGPLKARVMCAARILWERPGR